MSEETASVNIRKKVAIDRSIYRPVIVEKGYISNAQRTWHFSTCRVANSYLV